MSRAININAPEAHVRATCAKKSVGISTIETLRSGGTRVVTTKAADQAIIVKAYGSKVITGVVTRTPLRMATQ